MKTALIADSTLYLPDDVVEKHDINIIPLNVIFKDKVYQETELPSDEFYERMQHETELPTTSQPSIGDYVQLLEKLRDEGYTDAISVHLSSGISGTYQGAITAGSMVDGINMHAFDSELACLVAGFYLLKASEMKETHTPEEIIAELERLKQETDAFFLVDDLKNLQKGGRLNGAQAFIGSMLQVKPILHFEETKIVPFDKVRTKKKAVKKIEQLVKKRTDGAEHVTATIIHSNSEEEAVAWIEDLKKTFPHFEFHLSHFGPVIGTHLGEKALGFGIMKENIKF